MWCVIFTDDGSDGKEYTKVHGYFSSKLEAYQWAIAHDGHKRMEFGEFSMVDFARQRPA